MKIWDISRALTNDLAPWPGDTPFHFQLAARIGENAVVNVGAVTMGVHNGSHADARFHFEQDGETIDQIALDTYLGPATLVDLTPHFSGAEKELITIDHLNPAVSQIRQTSRLLLKTGVWPDNAVFPKNIPVIAPGVADWLQALNLKLIGLDLPSVDRIDAKVLQNHHALARCGINIVESLDLSKVG